MASKKLWLMVLFVCLWGGVNWVNAQRIDITFGTQGLRLPLNADVYIPVKIHTTSSSVCIGNLCIPFATDNNYITSRDSTNSRVFYPLTSWDDASFRNLRNNNPRTGWASLTLLGWADIGGASNPFLTPTTETKIAEFKMHTTSNTAYIGQTVDIFDSGNDPFQGPISIGDTFGGPGYTDIHLTCYPVTFSACTDSDMVGTGVGVMGNQQNHIDSYCYGQNDIRMYDVTKRQIYHPHGHSGAMKDTASIRTYIRNSSYPNLPGQLMSDADNNWNAADQAPGVDAHVYGGKFYEFIYSHLGRNGYDSIGSSFVSTVADNDPDLFNNAAWDPSVGQIRFGNVSSGYRSFAGCPDVVGHEWAHAITQYCSGLIYSAESGALNEAFSDMMGCSFTYIDLNDQQWWRLGENFFTNGSIIRDMQNPLTRLLPDTYLGQYWHSLSDTSDNYGVHTNCGVPDKMFYLLAVGGDHNGIHVNGIGLENATKVMYRANQRFWTSGTTFYKARWGSIRAAILLDTSGNFACQTAYSWAAVGVRDSCTYVPGDVNGNGEARGSDITRLVGYFKGTATIPDSCHCEFPLTDYSNDRWLKVTGDYNGDCRLTGGDVTYGVAYFKGFKPAIRWCPIFAPAANMR